MVSRQPLRPRWLLAVLDLVAWLTCFGLAAALRFDGHLTEIPWRAVLPAGAFAAVAFVAIAAMLHLYSGRHAVGSLDEALLLVMIAGRVALTMTAALALVAVRPVPLSLPLASAGTATLLIVGARVTYRLGRERRVVDHTQFRAVIVGAGDAGSQLVRNLLLDSASPHDPICFVDDDPRKRHYRAGMVRVEGRSVNCPASSATDASTGSSSRRLPPARTW